jgi:hypothetical protein
MQTGKQYPWRRPRRWFFCLLILAVVALALMFWLRPKPAAAVVLLSTWSSNGEEFVTFRVQPFEAEVHFADIVPASEDKSQPQTLDPGTNAPWLVRDSATPVVQGLSVRYIAMPFESVDGNGSNQPCTPGSYTIAYTPTSAVSQLRVGVANKESPLTVSSWTKRVRKAEESKNFQYLVMPTHLKPVYVKSSPITNAAFISK